MNKKRYIPSPALSLLKGALQDTKNQKLMDLCNVLQPRVESFSVYDQNSIGRDAIVIHYKGDPARIVGIELCVVDVGQSGPTFIDAYIKKRKGHLGIVPPAPYLLRAKREGNRLYRSFFPMDARSLGFEVD